MRVYPVHCLQDNYAYVLLDEKTNEAAVVDPVNPDHVMEVVTKMGCRLTSILTTHHHMDHSGGNAEMVKKRSGLLVHGADARIPEINYVVKDEEEFKVGSLTVRALHTPCHTKGSVCYYAYDSAETTMPGALFTGDTLFLGGCGRFFEGTADQMLQAMDKLSSLPDQTEVWCGHEYTKANLAFALSVDPDNSSLRSTYDRVSQLDCTMPGTIGNEKAVNPFMRTREPALIKITEGDDPEAVMKCLREWKNKFKA
ncbi:MAG: beta-lactamase-like protein [Piptocephalis tieghemiana]|nr:MAG: beta-lactamase-like protein [Piptocephalis tieghemiana]